VLGPVLAGLLTEAHVSTEGLFYLASLPMILGAAMQIIMMRNQREENYERNWSATPNI
jgi:hypothetical protein